MTIQASTGLFQSLLENTTSIVLGMDAETRLIYANPHAHQVLRYAEDELNTRRLVDMVVEQKHQRFASAITQAITEGSISVDLILRRKDGSPCVISGMLSRWQYDNNTGIAFYGMEKSLTSRELSLTTLVNNLPGYAYRCLNDKAWTTLLLSDGVTEVTGYAPADLINNTKLSFTDIIHPDDRARDWEDTQLALREHRPYKSTYRIITAGGQERWVLDHGRGIYDANDELVALEGLIVDVTDQKRVESALNQSERRYAALVNSIPDLMFRVDGDGIYLDFKPTANLYVPPDQIIGKKLIETLPPDVGQRSMAAIRHTIETGEMSVFEYQLPNLEKVMFDYEARVALVSANEVFCIIRDITERKKTERELRETEERLSLLIANTSVMLYGVDRDLKITFARGAVLNRFGVASDSLVGHSIYVIARNYPIVIGAVESVLRGETKTFTLQIAQFSFLVTATPLIDEHGNITGAAGAMTDITQEAQTELALRDAVNQLVLQYEASRALMSANTMDDLLSAFAGRAINNEGCHASLWYVHSDLFEEPERVELAAFVTPPNAKMEVFKENLVFNVADLPVLSNLQSGFYQMMVVAKVDKEEKMLTEEQRAMIANLGVEAFAVIPLKLHDKWIGLIAMAWDHEREFKMDERQYYETLAPQFAAALENLLLFEEIETALDENHRLLIEASYNEDLLRRFVEHMPLAIAMFDTDMRYLVANHHWQSSYRLKDANIIGRSHYEVFPEINEEWKEIHRRCLAGEIMRREADPFERGDGTIDWVRWEVRPWHTFDGRVGGLVMYTEVINEQIRQQKERDTFIAELRVANEKAMQASRMKSEFLATMSHELRTPLNTIIGFSGIMLEGIAGTLDETTRHMVNAIYESGESLLGLINDILDISKIEAGWFELVVAPIDTRAMIDNWELRLTVLAAKKDLRFTVEVDHNLPDHLIGDRDRITQIATNLLSNAFKFTDAGEVDLAVRWRDESLVIEVRDTGIGIPEEAMSIIFEAFRQVDSSTRRPYGGTGLGLSIVRRLCDAMGGWIKVHSTLGQGSTFAVSLPLKPHSPRLQEIE